MQIRSKHGDASARIRLMCQRLHCFSQKESVQIDTLVNHKSTSNNCPYIQKVGMLMATPTQQSPRNVQHRVKGGLYLFVDVVVASHDVCKLRFCHFCMIVEPSDAVPKQIRYIVGTSEKGEVHVSRNHMPNYDELCQVRPLLLDEGN